MAVGKQKLGTEIASRKTGRTSKHKAVQRASRGSAARKDGAEQLADLLEGKALEGDLASTKVLFGLAERKQPIPAPVKRRRGLSPAQRLAAEPKWQGEEEDGD